MELNRADQFNETKQFDGADQAQHNFKFEHNLDSIEYVPPSTPTPGSLPTPRNQYQDSIYNDEVVLAVLGNVSIKIDNRNSPDRWIKGAARLGNRTFVGESLGTE